LTHSDKIGKGVREVVAFSEGGGKVLEEVLRGGVAESSLVCLSESATDRGGDCGDRGGGEIKFGHDETVISVLDVISGVGEDGGGAGVGEEVVRQDNVVGCGPRPLAEPGAEGCCGVMVGHGVCAARGTGNVGEGIVLEGGGGGVAALQAGVVRKVEIPKEDYRLLVCVGFGDECSDVFVIVSGGRGGGLRGGGAVGGYEADFNPCGGCHEEVGEAPRDGVVYFAKTAVLPSCVTYNGNACVGVPLGGGIVDDEVRGGFFPGEGRVREKGGAVV
jgi:hypothetical protein